MVKDYAIHSASTTKCQYFSKQSLTFSEVSARTEACVRQTGQQQITSDVTTDAWLVHAVRPVTITKQLFYQLNGIYDKQPL